MVAYPHFVITLPPPLRPLLYPPPPSLQLAAIMAADPYFLTQDNGAGAPVHFATTYRQLDMVSRQGSVE